MKCTCGGMRGAGDQTSGIDAGPESVFSETTTVQFDQLTDADIRAYVETGESSGSCLCTETLAVQHVCMTSAPLHCQVASACVKACCAAGECFGKAGSYGIQGPAMQFVRRVDGCYFNVMGFPVNAFSRRVGELIEAGTLAL